MHLQRRIKCTPGFIAEKPSRMPPVLVYQGLHTPQCRQNIFGPGSADDPAGLLKAKPSPTSLIVQNNKPLYHKLFA
jgi:hypothetical protein